MELSTQPGPDSPVAAEVISAAGRWLVSLCTRKGPCSDQPNLHSFTALEQSKFHEFFKLYQDSPVFKKYHVEAVSKCLSNASWSMPDYSFIRVLLDKDGTKSLFTIENDVLQVAIKSVGRPSGMACDSPKELWPELIPMVGLLIDHGAAVNSLDSSGNSALFYACTQGYEELFHFLLAAGAELFTEYQREPDDTFNPWQMGQRSEAKVNVLKITLDALMSPRHLAHPRTPDSDVWKRDIGCNYGGIILHLLQKGISCDKQDPALVTVLHIACYQGASDFVKKLLGFSVAKGVAGVRMVNDRNMKVGRSFGTAVHAAAANCQLSIVKLLMEHGESPNTCCSCIRVFDDYSYHHENEEFTPVELAIASHVNDEALVSFLEGLMEYTEGLEESDYVAMIRVSVGGDHLEFTKRLLQRGVKAPEAFADVSSVDMAQLLTSYNAHLDPVAVQSTALGRGQLDLLRWCVGEYGPQLPTDPENWQKVAFGVLSSVPSDLNALRYLVSEYPGPHIDTVLTKCKRWHRPKPTSWLDMAIFQEDWKAVRLLLELGADPTFPGLPCDAATAMRIRIRKQSSRVTLYRDIEQILEIIRILETTRHENEILPEPSYEELCSRQAETIATQRNDWNRQQEELLKCRQDIPYRRLQEEQAPASTSSAMIEYHSLSNKSSFRLLDLLPSTSRSAPLRARLIYSDVTLKQDYEALSYVWGQAVFSRTIVVGEKTVAITPSLHSALVHLRHSKNIRTLWVDALCIDQSNNAERNQQVTIMGDIYKTARQVVVWLGEAADDSQVVFEHLNGPCNYSASPRELRAWKALITRPWFFRTWVIQEVALSSKAVIVCGEDSAPWNPDDTSWVDEELPPPSGITGGGNGLSRAPMSKFNWVDDPLSGFDADGHVERLDRLRPGSHPVSVLQYSRVCQTSEVKDTVYGILGLLEPGLMTVDYNLPVGQIFHQFTKAVIQSQGDLLVLRIFGIGASSKLGSLPSWVPDFTCTTMVGTLDMRRWDPPEGTPETLTFRMGDGTESSVSSKYLLGNVLAGLSFRDNGTMLVKGKRVDSIRALGPELPEGTTCMPGTNAFAQVIKAWESLAVSLCLKRKGSWGGPVTKAFANTLAPSYKSGGYSIDIGFTQWYRHYGAGILATSDPAMFLRNMEFYNWWTFKEKVRIENDWDEYGYIVNRPAHMKVPNYHLDSFMKDLVRSCYGRRFFITEGGSMGLAGPRAKVGDHVVFLPGADMPFVLRRVKDGNGWIMASDCYLYGLNPYELFQDEGHLGEEFVIF